MFLGVEEVYGITCVVALGVPVKVALWVPGDVSLGIPGVVASVLPGVVSLGCSISVPGKKIVWGSCGSMFTIIT